LEKGEVDEESRTNLGLNRLLQRLLPHAAVHPLRELEWDLRGKRAGLKEETRERQLIDILTKVRSRFYCMTCAAWNSKEKEDIWK
jgi:hypothetical protein